MTILQQTEAEIAYLENLLTKLDGMAGGPAPASKVADLKTQAERMLGIKRALHGVIASRPAAAARPAPENAPDIVALFDAMLASFQGNDEPLIEAQRQDEALRAANGGASPYSLDGLNADIRYLEEVLSRWPSNLTGSRGFSATIMKKVVEGDLAMRNALWEKAQADASVLQTESPISEKTRSQLEFALNAVASKEPKPSPAG